VGGPGGDRSKRVEIANMERRARTDSQYSCSYLFTLGLLVGAGLGMVTTYLQINPFQSLLPSGTDMSLDE